MGSAVVAENFVLTCDADNNVVLIDMMGGVRELFAELIEKEVEARLRKQKAS